MIIEFPGKEGTIIEEDSPIVIVYLDYCHGLGTLETVNSKGILIDTLEDTEDFDWEEILRIDVLHKGKGNEKLLELLMTKGRVKE
jgi:hypothetical protein